MNFIKFHAFHGVFFVFYRPFLRHSAGGKKRGTGPVTSGPSGVAKSPPGPRWDVDSLNHKLGNRVWSVGCQPKNRGGGIFPPKWMVTNNGSKPYEQMDDLGGFPIFMETPSLVSEVLGFLVEFWWSFFHFFWGMSVSRWDFWVSRFYSFFHFFGGRWRSQPWSFDGWRSQPWSFDM